MNKFKFYLILSIITVSIISCSKDKAPPVEPPRDFATQYTADNTVIEDYLKANFITIINHAGFDDDQDVTISPITNGETSIWDQTVYQLKTRNISIHNITYKTYYLVLRTGLGESPSNVDGVLASYKGDYLEPIASTTSAVATVTATKFEEVKYPQSILSLNSAINGWSEIFPQFKTGTYAPHLDSNGNADGTITYKDFGAGVMFLPSGLGYYNTGSGAIPPYTSLVFSFKLYEIQRLDQDADGIPSYLEDLDGYMYDYRNIVNYPTAPVDAIRYADDTDKDGIPDFLDVDDDGDNYTTKLEIKNPATGLPYPFGSIPTCTSGKKNYLDATCHP